MPSPPKRSPESFEERARDSAGEPAAAPADFADEGDAEGVGWESSEASALDSFESEGQTPPSLPSTAATALRVRDAPAPLPRLEIIIDPPRDPWAPSSRDTFANDPSDMGGGRIVEALEPAGGRARRWLAWLARAVSRLRHGIPATLHRFRSAREADSRATPRLPRMTHAEVRGDAPPWPRPATGPWLSPLARRRLLAASVAVAVAAAVTATVIWYLAAARASVLTLTSRPAGAHLLIDGELRGVTPLTLHLREGDHVVELRSAGPTQVLTLRTATGGQVSRFFDLPVGTAAASLQVITRPAGALVRIDGRPRGRTPLTVSDLNPGAHSVRVDGGTQSAERLIMLESGANGAVTLPLDALSGAPTEGYGWLAVAAPLEVQAFEQSRLVGSTRAGPWQLPAGRHELTFINPSLDVHVARTVDVLSGRTVTLDVPVPPAELSIMTSPEAAIQVDGESLGTSPVRSLALVAGQHDIVARHPVLGERRLSVTVVSGGAVSVGIDFRR